MSKTEKRPLSTIFIPIFLIAFSMGNLICLGQFNPDIVKMYAIIAGFVQACAAFLIFTRRKSGRTLYVAVMPVPILILTAVSPSAALAFVGYGIITFFLFRPKVSTWFAGSSLSPQNDDIGQAPMNEGEKRPAPRTGGDGAGGDPLNT